MVNLEISSYFSTKKVLFKGADFINDIIVPLYDANKITFGVGDYLTDEMIETLPNNIYKRAFDRFRNHKIGDKYTTNKEFTHILDLALYYYLYIQAHWLEPFNLLHIFYNYLEYGRSYGDSIHYLCTARFINRNWLSVTYLRYNYLSGYPVFDDGEKKEVFNFDTKNATEFMESAWRFNNMFDITTNCLDTENLVENLVQSIKNSQHALRILKKIKED